MELEQRKTGGPEPGSECVACSHSPLELAPHLARGPWDHARPQRAHTMRRTTDDTATVSRHAGPPRTPFMTSGDDAEMEPYTDLQEMENEKEKS